MLMDESAEPRASNGKDVALDVLGYAIVEESKLFTSSSVHCRFSCIRHTLRAFGCQIGHRLFRRHLALVPFKMAKPSLDEWGLIITHGKSLHEVVLSGEVPFLLAKVAGPFLHLVK